MKISLQQTGRRFNREWIFRELSHSFEPGNSYAILGPNGSGKSTLLSVLNGSLSPSAGTITFSLDGAPVPAEDAYRHLALAAPYMELIEEFSMSEMLDFHFRFKRYRAGMDREAVIELLDIPSGGNKLIRYFSSGMKQRLKLALAFCSDTPVLLLDEPTSNLDQQGVAWYLELIREFAAGRLTIICSNQEQEYSFCDFRIQITDYKSAPARAAR